MNKPTLLKKTLPLFLASLLIPLSGHTTENISQYGVYDATGELNISNDDITRLIEEKNLEYEQATTIFLETNIELEETGYLEDHAHNEHRLYEWGENTAFDAWYKNYYNSSRANLYKNYLEQRVGKNNVPAMSQLLLTARSWSSCGAARYEVPPQHLWKNMVPTLELYATLKARGILPRNTMIRSVYRNPSLNRCARGSSGSKHLMNAAIDLWVPTFEHSVLTKRNVQDKICGFWSREGKWYSFGLGLYPSGSIHLDTQGYRKWGKNHSSNSSLCRH